MSSSARNCRQLWLTHVIVVLLLFFLGRAHAKSFLKADLSWKGLRRAQEDLKPALTDLLAYRDLDQDPVLKKAMHVIDNLVTQSTCHQQAAVQLLVTCKAAGKDSKLGQGRHEFLERTKSTYAVRVAVCETGEGRAAVPAACRLVLDMPQNLQGDLEVVNSKNLASCLEALMTEHYYWTSYSNNRQEANTLCQAGSVEASTSEALHSYQKLAELLPDFRDILSTTRTQWLDFLKQQKENAQDITEIQQKSRAEVEEQREAEMDAFQHAMSAAKDDLESVSETLYRSMAKTGSGISQTQEALGKILSDFANLQALLVDAAHITSKNNAEVAETQAKNVKRVHELAVATTEVLTHLHADEAVQHINGLFLQVKDELAQLVSAQSQQLASAEQQLQMSAELSDAQKTNLALGEEMRDSSQSLASHLDSASAVAGRVSWRLEKVNQALTQVERASSVLTALFAVLTIPAQVTHYLHLRLLAMFLMPATLLFFWKPRRYSCSLMAVYVFLESLISLFTEYKSAMSTSFGLLGHQSRALSICIFDFVKHHITLTLAASIVFVVFCCCFVIKVHAEKPKIRSKRSTSKSSCGHTFNEGHFVEHRLRSGKRLRALSPDRFRRAATVC
ncbi:hypothetical protein PV11_08048 [Exophiala sideris]|uniref:Nuclear fusion protein KAR5 n=1 Tax=Exophiala sideris TaxID=1016849 RepID=A0A0D1VWC4_9EURO|nr:hypothetical protein PV11_08048 [Exophiala sideris]